ncbi:MAG: peptidylprolyl isomerase [Lentisphaerae bacterium]|nr:peptidylprolyl isomerase [Lentisphaerota bacterium]
MAMGFVVAGAARAQSDGLYADFVTSLGSFTCRLDYVNAPRTVANFIGLATGARTWLDLATGAARSNGFYNGLTFHRVIPGFMIQGGSPNGQGTDGPGYTFPDEFSALLRHDAAGVLSMANSGADSNGSQFFITVAATPWLDDAHSVFGRVEAGMDVVNAISVVDRDGNDVPTTPVVVSNVTIRRVGAAATAFNAPAHKLPVVSNVRLGISGGAGESVDLAFQRRAYTQTRLYATEDLSAAAWSTFDLGTEGATPGAGGQSVSLAGVNRMFFSLAQVQYPLAHASMLNRTMTLSFSGGDTIIIFYNGSGGGAYTYVGYGSGVVSFYTWNPGIYRGYLSPIVFDNSWRLDLLLTPVTENGGAFLGYTFDQNEQVWKLAYRGSYTLTP